MVWKIFMTEFVNNSPVDAEPQVGLEFGVVGPRREHFACNLLH